MQRMSRGARFEEVGDVRSSAAMKKQGMRLQVVVGAQH